ncbi:MAG: hypothetical protein VXZ72_01635 [Chlamydiota bacterium]|nr:hypothetical protein [Chlamydiota bacterium]
MTRYPITQLMIIKKKRLESAEKAWKKAKEKLQNERAKEKKLEKEKDKSLSHRNDKLRQLRQQLDSGEPSEVILATKRYLTITNEDLDAKQRVWQAQKEVVAQADQEVKLARKECIQKECDLEKIKEHQILWLRDHHKHEVRIQDKEEDELGMLTHQQHQRSHV